LRLPPPTSVLHIQAHGARGIIRTNSCLVAR
jgi:hypothetical protein